MPSAIENDHIAERAERAGKIDLTGAGRADRSGSPRFEGHAGRRAALGILMPGGHNGAGNRPVSATMADSLPG